ncbi:zinc-dependent metalloprotease [Neolewinella lacunae]|uniref:Zinc-dependent metalloprotease n=1 Tax=Neolewinella lacunae TaxID=1517758 RepID=A0A923PJ05_9BACT|nr:zinc-dependent metalloprotease [Neolewinella lacunae]MBC6994967.1 zinc-dependent metalloprotease [Neolewinella lacunae]MDN3633262.1 zinc-dependent metalloprotease [Neolewinella lacunae]
MRLLLFGFLCSIVLIPCTCVSAQKAAEKLPTIAEKTADMALSEGFFNYYWSDDEGKIYLEIARFGEEFLYVNSLAAGLGSNDIGLDRNQLGDSRVVAFERVGPRVLLKQRNLEYRAISDNADEANSVRDAFAQSVLEGFKVVAKTEDRCLIDLTPLLLSDAHGVIERLKRNKQGTYKVSADRSAIYPERTKNFPKNSEFEATITFTGEASGSQVRSVTPTSESFTLRMHHSFVELPDDQYRPRVFDPRSGYYERSYADYATPIDQPLIKRFITRHRLEKKDPTAAVSEAVEPIVYYLDRGAPEPIRSALLEGASWWNQAFEAAGYRNAFQVKILPEDADPLDVRYNVINWVHRSTRGWSYGSSVTDPRTGEIIKGHVLLGSLRVRQDFLLAQGLIKAYGADGITPDPRLEELALARLRQLSAHEVGHTIGLAHNFAASTNQRASVMDYPHPYVTLEKGQVDFSQAYAVGIGEWDKQAIRYGYADFPVGTDEAAGLQAILTESDSLGLRYVSDPDARPAGSSQAEAHLWDNGADPIVEMNRLLVLRQHAMDNFGPENIPYGMPYSELESVFVPVYLMHRYQVEAVSKMIGGYTYDYAVREPDAPKVITPVHPHRQEAALNVLLKSLSPEVLAVPHHVIALIPPPALGYSRNRELFNTRNGGGFDPLAMAAAACDNTLAFLLHPHRLARLVEQGTQYPQTQNLAISGYLERIASTLEDQVRQNKTGYPAALAETAERRMVAHLLQLAADKSASEDVQAAALAALISYRGRSEPRAYLNLPHGPHYRYLITQINNFLSDPGSVELRPALELPDGSPIGCGELH